MKHEGCDFISFGKEIILKKQTALGYLAGHLDDSAVNVCSLLLACQGSIILSG